jgi:hypothetical protein
MALLPWVLAGSALTGALLGNGNQPQPQGAPAQPQGSNTLANLNNWVGLGATLGSIAQSESDRARANRQANMVNLPRPQPMTGYQPTADDPRLQQILGRR